MGGAGGGGARGACNGRVSEHELRAQLSAVDLAALEKTRADAVALVVAARGSMLSKCPNEKCGHIVEKAPGEVQGFRLEYDDQGKAMSAEALAHRDQHRLRCQACGVAYCTSCKALPYHLGKTCEAFRAHAQAVCCRFCDSELPADRVAADSAAAKAAVAAAKQVGGAGGAGGAAPGADHLPL
jgi:hypothetical protein